VLEVRWQNHRLIARFPRQLDPQVPQVEGDERELVVLGQDVLLCEGTKTVDGIAEGARVADLVPSERGQACCRCTSANCNAAVLECFDLLHKAVMGVFTGFTSITALFTGFTPCSSRVVISTP
jgi:hypothetical protein